MHQRLNSWRFATVKASLESTYREFFGSRRHKLEEGVTGSLAPRNRP